MERRRSAGELASLLLGPEASSASSNSNNNNHRPRRASSAHSAHSGHIHGPSPDKTESAASTASTEFPTASPHRLSEVAARSRSINSNNNNHLLGGSLGSRHFLQPITPPPLLSAAVSPLASTTITTTTTLTDPNSTAGGEGQDVDPDELLDQVTSLKLLPQDFGGGVKEMILVKEELNVVEDLFTKLAVDMTSGPDLPALGTEATDETNPTTQESKPKTTPSEEIAVAMKRLQRIKSREERRKVTVVQKQKKLAAAPDGPTKAVSIDHHHSNHFLAFITQSFTCCSKSRRPKINPHPNRHF